MFNEVARYTVIIIRNPKISQVIIKAGDVRLHRIRGLREVGRWVFAKLLGRVSATRLLRGSFLSDLLN